MEDGPVCKIDREGPEPMLVMEMNEKYTTAFHLGPEAERIVEMDLWEKNLAVWEHALDLSPVTPEDLERILFTLLIEGCQVTIM